MRIIIDSSTYCVVGIEHIEKEKDMKQLKLAMAKTYRKIIFMAPMEIKKLISFILMILKRKLRKKPTV